MKNPILRPRYCPHLGTFYLDFHSLSIYLGLPELITATPLQLYLVILMDIFFSTVLLCWMSVLVVSAKAVFVGFSHI